jgi:hypothetical protein
MQQRRRSAINVRSQCIPALCDRRGETVRSRYDPFRTSGSRTSSGTAGYRSRSCGCEHERNFAFILSPYTQRARLHGLIGLMPKRHSSSGKERFVIGALAVIRYAKIHGTKHRRWLIALLARRRPRSQPSLWPTRSLGWSGP